MKININKIEENKCKKLLSVKENNIDAANIYIDYLNNHPFDIKAKNIDEHNKNASFYNAFLSCLGINRDDEQLKEIETTNKINEINNLNEDEYLNNEYAQILKNINIKEDDISLTILTYKAYEAFTYDEIKVNPKYYEEITPFGYFDKRFDYLAIIKDETIWMSLIPHEINSMKEDINKAYGKVVIFGLGLGYFAHQISLKEDVNQIIIVENDKKIIDIFNKYLLPHFQYKEKIIIIYEDAFHYLNKGFDADFLYIDIYHNVEDGLPLYLKIKQYEKHYPYVTFAYWIEESFIAMLRRQLLTIFEEQYYEHFLDSNYKIARNLNDKIINTLYERTKDINISNYEDLHHLLEDQNIKELVKDLKINF